MRTVFLDKDKMMENVQKHNICITNYAYKFSVPPIHFDFGTIILSEETICIPFTDERREHC
jgi:hypothetical protein